MGKGCLRLTRQWLHHFETTSMRTHRARERPEVVVEGRTTGSSSVSIEAMVVSIEQSESESARRGICELGAQVCG